jgi:ParB family transcriptional regulator, chromosome partitioning protein
MARRSGLGRGLDALIPGDEPLAMGGVLLIPVEQVLPNPRQPRSHFDGEELDELASSIREHGIIQPLVVTISQTNTEQYILIAGERRWLAARKAGLELVPAIVREASDQQRLELALIENVQRSDLGPLETAEAYRQLSEDFQLSHEQIAARVFKSRSAVTNTLRLLKLPPDVQAALVEKKISEGHARALLALPTQMAQSAAMQTVLRYDLNVRQTEELVTRLSGGKTALPPKVNLSPEMSELEERLRSRLGTKVRLTNHGKRGTIVIHYYSDEELTALVGQLLSNE